ncbi:MAG: hypothetical protein MJZ74_03760 [Muribaculaceae bacterium]|nr:hypothetical protein [Muribaculaceae bacterium]
MKKIILLALTLIALAFNAQAGTGGADLWYYSNLMLDVTPTGAGKVYANGKETEASKEAYLDTAPKTFSISTHQSKLPYTWYINTAPTDSKKYKFVGWKDANGKYVSDENGHLISVKDSKGVKAGGTNTGTSGEAYTNPGTITLSYTAVYEEIINQYVSVSSNDISAGSAIIDKPENQLGEEVTIYAYPVIYSAKFDGWEKDGIIVSKEPRLTFTISNENKGDYKAVFSKGYAFYRIKNKETNRRINAIKDQGSIQDFSALNIVDNEKAISLPGSIWEISSYKASGRVEFVYTFKAQGYSSDQVPYNVSQGVFLCSDHETSDNTWYIYPNGQPMYMSDKGGDCVEASAIKQQDIAHWYYEPMDKDLTTKENYFTFDPEKLLLDETTGKYYTTLRTAWNVLFDTNEITAYIVTGVDEDGILTKTEVTGGIIPKNTCVLIECNSNDTDRNVMVPTNTAASFTATSGNILVSSTKYFPNQDAVASNCKALTLVDGAVGFGGEACSKINGNDAYMLLDDDVFVAAPEEAVLGTVIDNETTNKKYDVTDLTCVMAVPSDDGSAVLYCKDENGYATPDMKGADEKDYILDIAGGALQLNRDNHDQSNWVALYAPATLFPATPQSAPGMKAEQGVTNAMVLDLKEQKINNVVGTVTDLKNPSLTLKALPAIKEQNAYSYNTYVPANFYGSQKGYFFISPKPMEIAQIRWAVWAGDHFEGIPKTATTNSADLEGAFGVNWSLMGGMPEDVTVNHIYDFLGLIKLESPAISQAAGAMAVAPNYVVYPFGLEDVGEVKNGVVTGINDLNGNAAVKSVKYYNLLGVGSDTPHQGVNIVISTMNDGTTVTSKRVF